MKKLTQKELFVKVIAELEKNGSPSDLVEGIKERLEVLNNKKTTTTTTQKQNLEIAEIILQVIAENGKPMTITELMKNNKLQYSNQKLSAICNQMVKADKPRLTREVGKNKKVTFNIIKQEEEDNEEIQEVGE